jgi:hypothetical protein
LKTVFDTDDPTNEISAAWGIKELLRQMLQAHGPNGYRRHQTSTRRTRFLQACVDADMPEAIRLAATIERWWPEIEGFLELGNTNDQVSHCTSSCCFGWWCGTCPLSGPVFLMLPRGSDIAGVGRIRSCFVLGRGRL